MSDLGMSDFVRAETQRRGEIFPNPFALSLSKGGLCFAGLKKSSASTGSAPTVVGKFLRVYRFLCEPLANAGAAA
jgi:hypothetical protein